MFILLVLVELAAFVCFIMVLIKQFQTAGPLHGIIGIITCGIWTFIWGWMNATSLNIKNIMMIWTLLIVLCLVLQFVFGISFYPRYAVPATP
jgi:membrane protein insertase Oxa1/YidC/SpoIIIJ